MYDRVAPTTLGSTQMLKPKTSGPAKQFGMLALLLSQSLNEALCRCWGPEGRERTEERIKEEKLHIPELKVWQKTHQKLLD